MGRLRFKNFKRLIDENPQVKTVELSNWGEMFLNPDLDKIMKLAQERKIRLRAKMAPILILFRRETLENLVKYQFRDFRVSLDGATQETDAEYRINGNIEKVLKNIRKLNEHKKKYRSKYPRLCQGHGAW